MHKSGWVGLREFFDPTHYGGLKKIQTNPTQPTWVGLNPLVGQFFYITIIIKLSKIYIYIYIYITPATLTDKQNIHVGSS